MARRTGNRVEPRFPIGTLVRVVSDRDIPPEGFRLGSHGFTVWAEEIPDGALGVVVNSSETTYTRVMRSDEDVTAMILIEGEVLEVPYFHIRRVK